VTGEEHDPQHDYEIRVRGHLGTKMRRAFPALKARPHGEDTLLTGRLPDQAAVYGVIARLEALGLDLLELRRLTTDEAKAKVKSSPYAGRRISSPVRRSRRGGRGWPAGG
jgi:hypothetical protein